MISILTHKTPDNLKHMIIARLQIKQTHHQCVILPILSPLMASAFFFSKLVNIIYAFLGLKLMSYITGFSHSSVGKESACNAGDPGWIPGLGRSPGRGHGNPL